MNILVCFKTLPDFDQIIDSDWAQFAPGSDLSYAKRIFNYFDESALEIALRLRDALAETGQSARCTALTLGAPPPAPLRKTLFATGFAEVCVLEDEHPEFQPARVAERLAAFARAGGFDLILTGRQAGMADSGTVPLLLAEHLRLPVLTEAETVEACEGGVAVVQQTDFGTRRLRVRLPAVVAVGNSPVTALRAATLREQLEAGKRTLSLLPAEAPAPVSQPALSQDAAVRKCRFLAGETPAELAAALRREVLKGGGGA